MREPLNTGGGAGIGIQLDEQRVTKGNVTNLDMDDQPKSIKIEVLVSIISPPFGGYWSLYFCCKEYDRMHV